MTEKTKEEILKLFPEIYRDLQDAEYYSPTGKYTWAANDKIKLIEEFIKKS